MFYKEVIELHIKKISGNKILAIIQFELDQFSKNFQKNQVISIISFFYQEISSLFRYSNCWSTATETEVCK